MSTTAITHEPITKPPLSVCRPGELVRVYVWQWPVRMTHWCTAYSILLLAMTGFYMGNPFITVRNSAPSPPWDFSSSSRTWGVFATTTEACRTALPSWRRARANQTGLAVRSAHLRMLLQGSRRSMMSGSPAALDTLRPVS